MSELPNIYVKEHVFDQYLAEHSSVQDAKDAMKQAVEDSAPGESDA